MRRDSAIGFEATAARIRARAERMLAELPVEDPNVVYARRLALVLEASGRGTVPVRSRVRGQLGVVRWSSAAGK